MLGLGQRNHAQRTKQHGSWGGVRGRGCWLSFLESERQRKEARHKMFWLKRLSLGDVYVFISLHLTRTALA